MRILVVEDEKQLADGIESVLNRAGYVVDLAYEGQKGYIDILSDIYDLILLDIMLPGMNGLEILKRVRAEGIKTPIILLTALSQVSDKIQGLDSGADDYITKPFDADELLARIRVRTRQTGQEESESLICGNVRLSRSAQTLAGPEKNVKLGNKEYQLLEYLMLNQGKILTKESLIFKVWGPLGEPDYNNLEVYVSFIRKKLKFVNASCKIVTTKNVGYSLEK